MRNKKIYGESKTEVCPFCSREAYGKNKQQVPVCKNHKNMLVREDLKCICGQYIDLCIGKYGPYFKCNTCGNINFNKAMEINNLTTENIGYEDTESKTKKSTSINVKTRASVDEKNALIRSFLSKVKK